MKKNIIFIIIAAVVAILAMIVIWQQSQKPVGPEGVPTAVPARPIQDTTTSIQSDLNAIEVNNLDSEFSDIDKELQSL